MSYNGGILIDTSGNVKYRWKGYTHFLNNNPLPPYPNGTLYVPGQGTDTTIPLYSVPTTGAAGAYNSIHLKPPYTWNASPTLGPYYKPLITYEGPPGTDLSANFTEKTYTYTVDNMPTYRKGVIGFRIFQERETGGNNDVYGVRYIETEIDYTCYHPEYYIFNK